MRLYIISGEASGDLHASNLVKAFFKEEPTATIRAWGGDLTEQAGAQLAKHYRELAFMGIIEVLKNLRKILGNFKFCKADIEAFQPDALVLIDYSGFNLRIAKWAKKKGYKVYYYISPQVWATRAKRVHKIKQYVDELFSILPFEEAFYQKYNYKVNYVGHPLLDVVRDSEVFPDFRQRAGLDNRPVIALLPGSRKQEVRAMLEVMLSVQTEFQEYQFVIGGAPSLDKAFYAPFIEGNDAVRLVENETYNLLNISDVALVTSGTATLEAALFEVPQVVCYRASALLYFIVKRIIKVPYISIVNLIMGAPIVKELIQNDLNTAQLKNELARVLQNDTRQQIAMDYKTLKAKLGNSGAAERVAKKIQANLKSDK